MKARVIGFIIVLVWLGNSFSQHPFENELPVEMPAEEFQPLKNLSDPPLQQSLQRHLVKHRLWRKLIRKQQMAVGIVDLRDAYHIKFARVNGDVMMYAASLPKLAILLAVSQAMENGNIRETPAVLHDMRQMISCSDNVAATRLYNRVGFQRIEAVLTRPDYGFYDPNHGGLWVGKPYSKSGYRHPDPFCGIVHGATVTQVCRFYYLLAFGKLVSWQRSRQMLSMLVNPEIEHKFVKTLHRLAPNARLYRKSGTWRSWHSDSVLVWEEGGWRRYIVVALVYSPRGEEILQHLIPVVETVLLEQPGD